jgi:SAM-dependent methyltransferase
MSASSSCPLCASSNTVILNHVTAETSAAFMCPPSKNADRHRRMTAAIRGLWGGDEATIQRCRECGFGFGHPFVGGDAAFYSIMHEQHGYPSWRWDYDIALQHAPSAGGNALDFGAGRGFFLKGLGAEWKAHAVESTPTMMEYLRADGIAVYSALQDAPSGHFDMVTLFQVLEHISDFRRTISECRRLLTPSGRLVITVPDGDAMVKQYELTGAPDVPPNHVAKWTPSTLRMVLEEHGLKVEASSPEPSSLRNVQSNLHLKVTADALRPNSLAARAYSVKNRRVRAAMLAGVAGLTGWPMLRHWDAVRAGGAFAISASAA